MLKTILALVLVVMLFSGVAMASPMSLAADAINEKLAQENLDAKAVVDDKDQMSICINLTSMEEVIVFLKLINADSLLRLIKT